MSVSRYRVKGGGFDGSAEATVEIDRATLLVTVRPYRSHRAATMTLAALAKIVLFRQAQHEAAEKRARRTG